MIEQLAIDEKLNYMDAICHHCKTTELEIEVAATLISPPLKAKVREQAQELNLLKKSNRSAKLPL
jgi:hypothetical protein